MTDRAVHAGRRLVGVLEGLLDAAPALRQPQVLLILALVSAGTVVSVSDGRQHRRRRTWGHRSRSLFWPPFFAQATGYCCGVDRLLSS